MVEHTSLELKVMGSSPVTGIFSPNKNVTAYKNIKLSSSANGSAVMSDTRG